MPPTNDHVIALGEILMTYNTWERDLGELDHSMVGSLADWRAVQAMCKG